MLRHLKVADKAEVPEYVLKKEGVCKVQQWLGHYDMAMAYLMNNNSDVAVT